MNPIFPNIPDINSTPSPSSPRHANPTAITPIMLLTHDQHPPFSPITPITHDQHPAFPSATHVTHDQHLTFPPATLATHGDPHLAPRQLRITNYQLPPPSSEPHFTYQPPCRITSDAPPSLSPHPSSMINVPPFPQRSLPPTPCSPVLPSRRICVHSCPFVDNLRRFPSSRLRG